MLDESIGLGIMSIDDYRQFQQNKLPKDDEEGRPYDRDVTI